MTSPPFIVFGQPDIRDEDIAAVSAVLRSLWIGTGPRAAEFEARFAEYVGAPHATALNSCTAALHLALVLAGVGPGDEVIVPALTFASTANVVIHVGATPVFADVDPRTRCMGPEQLLSRITRRTKAAIPVHLAGYPCDLDALEQIRRDAGFALIVDAAHGIETQLRGEALGGRGTATAYSFYVTKNITTGEGGMLTTSDPALAERARVLSLHGLSADAWQRYSTGRSRTYEVIEPGYKYNMADLLAALGLSQLGRIEASYARRREIWSRYDDAFAALPLELPPLPEPGAGRSALHLYSPLIDVDAAGFGRDEARDRLHAAGVGTGVHFTALHRHPYYRDVCGGQSVTLPNAERIGARTLSLPLSSRLTDDEVDRIIAAVRGLFA